MAHGEDKDPETAVEADPRFPSGPWTGYYVQGMPGFWDLGWMRLRLQFAGGAVRGSGGDPVGDVVMKGAYDTETGSTTIQKLYVGQHEVVYAGISDSRGIRGRWQIGAGMAGSFHIWPLGAGEGAEASAAEASSEEAALAGAGHALAGEP